MAGVRMLEERTKFQALVLVYKCIHKEAPRYIEEFFKIKICNYGLRGSGTLLTLPNFNLMPQAILILGSKTLGFVTYVC